MDTANYDYKLDKGWYFHNGDLERKGNLEPGEFHTLNQAGGALYDVLLDIEDGTWTKITVPHDWLAYQDVTTDADMAGGYKKRGKAWYYYCFDLDGQKIENARLVFEGILGQSTVFVNGIVAARNFSGYNRLSCNIEDYLLPNGKNEIAVFVDATGKEGWWYEGAGIYRDCYIEFRNYERIVEDHCFFRTYNVNNDWYVKAEIAAEGIEDRAEQFELNTTISDSSNNIIDSKKTRIKSTENVCLFYLNNPLLWTPETPELYLIAVELLKNGEKIDRITSQIGLRTVTWTDNNGMFLNGKSYRIKGICCHQDHAGVGAAVTQEIIEYRIRKLKQLGINAYRCAHHAPNKALLDTCDRLGMLVMVENRHFDATQETLKQLDDLIFLSRNHPSVFLYSLFNEEPWQCEERGKRIITKLRDRVRKIDDSRGVIGAQNSGLLEENSIAWVTDVIGANYNLQFYDACHVMIPGKAMLGTENCPTLATRGEYKTDRKRQIFADYAEEWADTFAESMEETFTTVNAKSYVAGCFPWSGFDHRGEPYPFEWPSVLSHWGIMDNCGFEKNTAYYLAAWYRAELFVHLLPHWNWQDGETVKVCAFTNADEVEVFVNGKSQGRKSVYNKRAEWEIPFEAGKIEAVGFRNGEVANDYICTAGKARFIKADIMNDKKPNTVSIINISIVDENKQLVPDYSELVQISVKNGRVLGVGNGDPNGHQKDVENEIPVFHGHAQVIVAGVNPTVTLFAGNLESTTLMC